LKTVTEDVPRGTGRRSLRQADRTAGRWTDSVCEYQRRWPTAPACVWRIADSGEIS